MKLTVYVPGAIPSTSYRPMTGTLAEVTRIIRRAGDDVYPDARQGVAPYIGDLAVDSGGGQLHYYVEMARVRGCTRYRRGRRPGRHQDDFTSLGLQAGPRKGDLVRPGDGQPENW